MQALFLAHFFSWFSAVIVANISGDDVTVMLVSAGVAAASIILTAGFRVQTLIATQFNIAAFDKAYFEPAVATGKQH